jgi:carbon storage regulator CsrA
MLVLTRGVGESIHIGPDVELKIISTGKKIKVGIEAPRTIEIWRGEKSERVPERHQEGQGRKSRFAVLLVEDNPVHAKIITHILRNTFAAEVAVTPTGEEAVRSLWNADEVETFAGLPNLILLDLRLPGMSGLDVLVKIKSDRQLRTTPVVILSSSDEPFEIERCLEAGANAFVTKSPNHDEFRAALSRIAGFWGSDCQTPEAYRLN